MMTRSKNGMPTFQASAVAGVATAVASFVLFLLLAASAAWSAPAAKGETQQVMASDAEALIADGLAQEGAGEKIRAAVSGRGSGTLYNGKGPLSIALTALDYNAQDYSFTATVVIFDNDKEAKSLDFSGRYDLLADIPVLARQLRKGDVIEASDIEWIAVPEQRLRKDTVTDETALVGRSPRRSIAARRPIRMMDVERPSVVEKGDAVQLSFRTETMEIRTLATALEGGSEGQNIRLRNADSGVVVQATITGKGAAEVTSLTRLSMNQ